MINVLGLRIDTGARICRKVLYQPGSMRFPLFLLLILSAPTLACAHGGGQCALKALKIETTSAGAYTGRTKTFEVRFSDDRPDTRVEVFADSALEIRHVAGEGQSCAVEGGVWARRGIFYSGDARTVVALESSGSNDTLVFIDSQSCQRVGQIDVSDAKWTIQTSDIVVVPVRASARTAARHRLDVSCRPRARYR